MELTRTIGDTDLKIDQNVIQLADAYKRRFESLQQPSEKKREKLRHQLALLGDINTAEEKRLAAQNAAENMNALVTEGSASAERSMIRSRLSGTARRRRSRNGPPRSIWNGCGTMIGASKRRSWPKPSMPVNSKPKP